MDLWSFNIIEIDANWRPIRVFLFVFHCNYNVYADCLRDDNELLVKRLRFCCFYFLQSCLKPLYGRLWFSATPLLNVRT